MSNELLSSKIVITEPPPTIRTIVGVPTAVPAFVGVAEWGPVGVATELTSFDEYVRVFGGFTSTAQDLPMAVRGFYLNGGSRCFVVRTLHYTTISNPATATGVKATKTLLDRATTPLSTLRVDGKHPGARGNNLKVKIGAATNGEADEFNLTVLEDDLVVEVFPNLSMTDADSNFVESVVNHATIGSNLIAVVDLDSATAGPNDLPALGTFALLGGNDGLTSLADADFLGDAAGKNGLRALDTVIDVTLVLVPGRATVAVHQGLLDYCEVTRGGDTFAILDPPEGNTASAIVTYVRTTAALLNRSEFGAFYWPRIKVVNPDTKVFGVATEVLAAPSGFMAGVYASNDGRVLGGVHRAPAGVERGILRGVVGLETEEAKDERKRDLVYPARINPITVLPGTSIFADGSRTLKGTGSFPAINERRGVNFIEQTVKLGLLFAKHTNNDAALRRLVNRTITSFLLRQYEVGAFRGRTPEESFFVDTSDSLNSPAVVFAGQLKVRVGLATQKPAEFIVLEFVQDTRRLEEEAALA